LKKVNSSEDDADSIFTARHAWACVKGCGACCVLDKGPDYPPVEEILTDPDEVDLFRSMVGADGWCIHYDKPSRSCTIHNGMDKPSHFVMADVSTKKLISCACCSPCLD
jgi:Fe-S-cluster containining protein